MRNEGRTVTLEWPGHRVALRGDRPDAEGLFVSGDGIEGWDSTPDAKVDMTEMASGDGAHPVREADIRYAARTVTVNYHAHASERRACMDAVREISKAVHRLVKLTVRDGGLETFATGYVALSVEPTWLEEWATGSFTVVCADPRRYSVEARRLDLLPTSSSATGGLSYGGDALGLAYPLDYGDEATDARNFGSATNAGTSEAYPVIEVYGIFEQGVRFDLQGAYGSSSIDWYGHIGQVPLVLDFLSRTATVGDLDVSRQLRLRGFAPIPPGGSMSVTMQGGGTGFATMTVRDTYL